MKASKKVSTDNTHHQAHSEQPIHNKEDSIVMKTPRTVPKTSENYKNNEESSDFTSECFSPNPYRKRTLRMEGSMVRSNAEKNNRPPSRSENDSSKMVSSTIRDIRNKIKNKNSNYNLIKK